eukprot:CAMPEP_0197851636 /NCGR_PEP_ID=MMETSP1438-20131217/18507_1 /TAXON_ID=1461541 /ORGANISM="Pterosperma sp., Strain CCMP1384" /LENGTH=150 /DNA_ID=CAMNT_0043465309 /DNA_START=42 /DNA_END=494 /DNA_ORIENTATION=+
MFEQQMFGSGPVIMYVQVGIWDACFGGGDVKQFGRDLHSFLQAMMTNTPYIHLSLATAMHNSLPQHQKRYNSTIVERSYTYNEEVKQVAQSLHLPVLDTPYKVTRRMAKQCLDGVHYDPKTNNRLGHVAMNQLCYDQRLMADSSSNSEYT